MIGLLLLQAALLSPYGAPAPSRPYELLEVQSQSPICLAFSPNDDLLVVSKGPSGKGADLQVWDTEKCVIKAVLKSHDARITCISFNPGGDMIASGDAKGKIIIWDA